MDGSKKGKTETELFCVTTTSSSFFLHYTHLLKIIDYLRGMVSRLQQDQVYNESSNKLKKRFQEQTKLAVACCFSASHELAGVKYFTAHSIY